MPGTVLGREGTAVIRMDTNPCPLELIFQWKKLITRKMRKII